MRDEAHRFAHGYNTTLRSKRTLTTELNEIPGIGPKRRRALLEHFGSVRRLRAASSEDIAALPGFSRALAEQILSRLRG
jgi:excinuclease ABC subunit C